MNRETALHVTASLNVAAHEAGRKRVIFVMSQSRHYLLSLTAETVHIIYKQVSPILPLNIFFNSSNNQNNVICVVFYSMEAHPNPNKKGRAGGKVSPNSSTSYQSHSINIIPTQPCGCRPFADLQ